MTRIYTNFEPPENATIEERVEALYLHLISTGEYQYCIGSHLSEITKQLNSLEPELVKIRREFAAIRDELRRRAETEGKG